MQAISYINYSAYKFHPYPLAKLSNILMIKVPSQQNMMLFCCRMHVFLLPWLYWSAICFMFAGDRTRVLVLRMWPQDHHQWNRLQTVAHQTKSETTKPGISKLWPYKIWKILQVPKSIMLQLFISFRCFLSCLNHCYFLSDFALSKFYRQNRLECCGGYFAW